MKKLILPLLALSCCSAMAQINIVADILPGGSSGDPTLITPFGSKLYFAATDSVNGNELYMYDGITMPSMVYNLNPGSAHGVQIDEHHSKMGTIGSKLYYCGNNGATGYELYSYAGTGTPVLEQDIETGTGDSNPANIFSYNNKIYFSAYTDATGYELYTYDGTTLTRIDINPGAAGSSPSGFTVYNNKIYFSAITAAAGDELFVYDPATNNFNIVADIYAGTGYSYPRDLTVLNGKLYFAARDAVYGFELYAYDGTTVTRLTDLAPGTLDGVYELCAYNNKLMLSGSVDGTNFQLYTYDPALNTATITYAINPGGDGNPEYFTLYNNKVYFSAADALHGNELWVYDGTTTAMVMDLNPGAGNNYVSDIIVWNNRLFMNATNGTTGYELYEYRDAAGLINVAFNAAVNIYPNPAITDCSLDIILQLPQQQASLSITDIEGKMVYSLTGNNYPAGKTTLSIPAHTFAPGSYTYHLCSEKGTQLAAGKLVKQ